MLTLRSVDAAADAAIARSLARERAMSAVISLRHFTDCRYCFFYFYFRDAKIRHADACFATKMLRHMPAPAACLRCRCCTPRFHAVDAFIRFCWLPP